MNPYHDSIAPHRHPIKVKIRFGFVYYAVKTGARGLPYCHSTNGRTCTVFPNVAAVANLLPSPPGIRPVFCTRANCKAAGNWCQLADLVC
jgi:hypothetical protein